MSKFEYNQFYHFYNRGNNKENIFKDKDNYFYFLRLLAKHILPFADVYSYCLLSNHFHIVLKVKERSLESNKNEKFSLELSQAFSNMFNAYTKAINKKHKRTGSLFQKHPKRIRITDLEYIQSLIVYVNTNSSKHKIEDYENYYFSSYKAIISKKETLIKRAEVIVFFDTKENFIFNCKTKKIDINNLEFE